MNSLLAPAWFDPAEEAAEAMAEYDAAALICAAAETEMQTPRPSSKPAGRYKLRGMTGLEFLDVQAMVGEANGQDWKIAAMVGRGELPPKAVKFALESCVTDWEDLADEAILGGAPKAFDKERLKDLCYDHMNALTLEIVARTVVTEDLEKNSSSALRSQRSAGNSTAVNASGATIAPH